MPEIIDQSNEFHQFGLAVIDELRDVHRLQAYWEHPGYIAVYLHGDRDLRPSAGDGGLYDYVGLYFDGEHERAGDMEDAGEIRKSDDPKVVAQQLAAMAAGYNPIRLREVLVHLNVQVPDDDTRTPNEIADAILGAINVGAEHESVRRLVIDCPLADEV